MADANVPNAFTRNFLESNPGYRPGQNPETDALFNPSIVAKPLHIPQAGQIRKRLNKEMEFYWAFDRNGQNPYHTRCEQLRAVGFDYATIKDVEMAVADTVHGDNEIRNGDRRLMKVPRARWMEIRKSQQLQAIMMSNPAGKQQGEDGTVMGLNNMPGVRTTVVEQGRIDELRASSVVSDAAQDLRDQKPAGNTSVVPKQRS